MIAWFVVIYGINTTSDISKLLYVISRAVRRVKYETVLKYHEWYCSCLSSLHCLSSPRWTNRYWRHIAGMGEEGVTLRWTIWTNTPFRGEYAACCKNLVNLQVYGFCQGRWSPGGLKKKSLVPPSPTSPYIKQKDFIRRGSSQPSPFKSLAAGIRDKQICLLSIIFEVANSTNQLWKTVRLHSFQRTIISIPVSIFFSFAHSWYLLFLLCYLTFL